MSASVVVAVPVYRFPLTEDEEQSLRHLFHFLAQRSITLVAPEGLLIDHPQLRELEVERFGPDYFRSTNDYNRLMLSREFYQRFAAFDFVLIYQLDCLVFADELEHWSAQKWDYIGAPWFREFVEDKARGFWAVGNGGLSLRRTGKFLEVLNSRRHAPPGPTKVALPGVLQASFLKLKKLAYAAGYKSSVQYVTKSYSWNEDGFWSFEAKHFAPDFAVPTPQVALSFAFEQAPAYSYELNGGRLPFGCHAWSKFDRKFWEPFLLP